MVKYQTFNGKARKLISVRLPLKWVAGTLFRGSATNPTKRTHNHHSMFSRVHRAEVTNHGSSQAKHSGINVETGSGGLASGAKN